MARCTGDEWSPEEVEFLRAHPTPAERELVADRTGRSVGAVYQQALKLELEGARTLAPVHRSGHHRQRRPGDYAVDPRERLARPIGFEDQRELARRMMAGR